MQIVTKLPKGMQFVRANNMGEYDAATHAVYWSLAELPKGERGTVELVAMPIETGPQTLQVEGHAQQGLTDHKQREIVVEGLAAIMFEVRDLEDPIEVGGETGYEIRVVNQGTKAATNVQVAVELPPGMKVHFGRGRNAAQRFKTAAWSSSRSRNWRRRPTRSTASARKACSRAISGSPSKSTPTTWSNRSAAKKARACSAISSSYASRIVPTPARCSSVRQQAAQMRLHALGQHGRVVAAFENADDAARRRGRRPRRSTIFVSSAKSSTSRPSEPIGSARWLSKPALTSTSCGRMRAANFSSSLANRSRYVARGVPNATGRFTRRAQAVAGARFVGRAGARIKRPAVDRKKSHAAVGVKHVLRAVAVVHVPIDDQHAVELMLVAGHAGRDRDVVEQAKAHRPFGERMMAGRPHEAQRGFRFAREHAIDRVARRAGRQLGHVERSGANDRIRIEVAAAARGERRDAVDVSGFVDAFEPRA